MHASHKISKATSYANPIGTAYGTSRAACSTRRPPWHAACRAFCAGTPPKRPFRAAGSNNPACQLVGHPAIQCQRLVVGAGGERRGGCGARVWSTFFVA